MPEDLIEKKSNFDLTSRSAFSNNEELSRQRAIEADLITKQRAQLGKKVIKERKSKVSELSGKPLDGMAEVHHKEKALLAKYDFNTLEYTTVKQMYEELALLQKWSMSQDEELKKDSDAILEIRTKELKFIVATSYANISNEIYKGYLALENYFIEISKYND